MHGGIVVNAALKNLASPQVLNCEESTQGKTDKEIQDNNNGKPTNPAEIKLTKKGKQAIGTLDEFKNKPAREVLKLRGGNNSATQKGNTDYWNMPLGDIANKAAQGDKQAQTILKLVKRATKYAQKYGGK